jgi:hypothetical protein
VDRPGRSLDVKDLSQTKLFAASINLRDQTAHKSTLSLICLSDLPCSHPEMEFHMTYDLVIGDRAYSSWSLRGWLLFDAFDIPVKLHVARLYTDELPNLLKDFFPGKTAPPTASWCPKPSRLPRN